MLHPWRGSIRHGLRLQFMRGGLLEPVPVPPPWGANTSRSMTPQIGVRCCAASLRFNRSTHVCHMCVAGFLYQIRRLSRPFPVPASRSAYCVPFVGFVPFLRLLRPRKTLARSPSPFPAVTRGTASSTASPRPRRCCVRPRGGFCFCALRLRLARLQRTSTAKVRIILIIANLQHKNLRILCKKVISY